ncbi:hypothetical protein OKW30_008392 [Paraburkholderia sp. Clong3]
MYGMLVAAVLMLGIVTEIVARGAGIQRADGFRAGAYPLITFAVVGGVTQGLGASFNVYSGMYFLAFVSAFFGPLLALASGSGRRARSKAILRAWKSHQRGDVSHAGN